MTAHYARCGHEVPLHSGPIRAVCDTCPKPPRPPAPPAPWPKVAQVVTPELAAALQEARAASSRELDVLLANAADTGLWHAVLAVELGISRQRVGQRIRRVRVDGNR